jgi:hypothetical protein
MAEIDSAKYEKETIKEYLIIGIICLILFLALVIYGFKMILGYNGLL